MVGGSVGLSRAFCPSCLPLSDTETLVGRIYLNQSTTGGWLEKLYCTVCQYEQFMFVLYVPQ
jgi:hypothetical protein